MPLSLLERFQASLLGSTLFLAQGDREALPAWIECLERFDRESLFQRSGSLVLVHPTEPSWPDLLNWLLLSLLYHDEPLAAPALGQLEPLTYKAWQDWCQTLAIILRGQRIPAQYPGPLSLPWLETPPTVTTVPQQLPRRDSSPINRIDAPAWLAIVLSACYYWADTPSQVVLSAHRVQQQQSAFVPLLTGALSGAYNGLAMLSAWPGSLPISSSLRFLLYEVGIDLFRCWSGALCSKSCFEPGLAITSPLVMQARPSLKLLSQAQYWIDPLQKS
ncbi:hypothetical protein [Synechocystis sp. LKSZ1]|uniref:hypothetical protein n=1 Tax=Synechocystis sp. LKSZ1 TaxID=3144951 RepID=UPI00336C16B5